MVDKYEAISRSIECAIKCKSCPSTSEKKTMNHAFKTSNRTNGFFFISRLHANLKLSFSILGHDKWQSNSTKIHKFKIRAELSLNCEMKEL